MCWSVLAEPGKRPRPDGRGASGFPTADRSVAWAHCRRRASRCTNSAPSPASRRKPHRKNASQASLPATDVPSSPRNAIGESLPHGPPKEPVAPPRRRPWSAACERKAPSQWRNARRSPPQDACAAPRPRLAMPWAIHPPSPPRHRSGQTAQQRIDHNTTA